MKLSESVVSFLLSLNVKIIEIATNPSLEYANLVYHSINPISNQTMNLNKQKTKHSSNQPTFPAR